MAIICETEKLKFSEDIKFTKKIVVAIYFK